MWLADIESRVQVQVKYLGHTTATGSDNSDIAFLRRYVVQGDVLLDSKAQHHLLVSPRRMRVASNVLAGYNVLHDLEASHFERRIMDNCTMCRAMARSSLHTYFVARR